MKNQSVILMLKAVLIKWGKHNTWDMMMDMLRNLGLIMSELIDAKGLGCAEPVILAKRALELHDEITILVDEQTALENLRVLGMHAGCLVNVTEEPGKTYSVHLKK